MRFKSALIVCAVLSGCVAKPQPEPAPQPAPAPRPVPAPVPQFPADWVDWPITPGDWSYARDARGSSALFGVPGRNADFTLRCDSQARVIFASRAGAFPEGDSGRMTIRTTGATKAYPAANGAETPPYVTARIEPADIHLDAIVFSRGRFLVQVKGGGDLVIPAWPEIAKVVEDCRPGSRANHQS